jgi:hypothetical protein
MINLLDNIDQSSAYANHGKEKFSKFFLSCLAVLKIFGFNRSVSCATRYLLHCQRILLISSTTLAQLNQLHHVECKVDFGFERMLMF